MKARLYSWFRSGNIGDIMIAKQVSELFNRYFDCFLFDISSGLPVVDEPHILYYSQNKKFLKRALLKNRVFRNLVDLILSFGNEKIRPFRSVREENCKLAIFAGGNSLMDLGCFLPTDSVLLYRRLRELKKKGFSIAFCFCGAGPYKNSISKLLFKMILDKIDFISVRDEASFYLCQKYGRKNNIEIWRDPVLFMTPKPENKEKQSIAVNVFFCAEPRMRSHMRNSYVRLVSFLLENFPQYKVKLFVSETRDLDDAVSIKSSFNNIDITMINSEDDLFGLYAESVLCIGCRMHSLISAIICKLPVVAIGWQEKVFSLMDFLDSNDKIVSQEVFCASPDTLFSIVTDVMRDSKEYCQKIENKLRLAEKELSDNMVRFASQWGVNNELQM